MVEYVDGDVSMLSEFLDLVSLGTAFPFRKCRQTRCPCLERVVTESGVSLAEYRAHLDRMINGVGIPLALVAMSKASILDQSC
ncbi:hypothetical protein CN116_01730 [Sinorhizobium meliloti]|nr:hypothetical protein CN229_22905 [Sinorhizobium meliloti]RVM12824.1 hypothetical protein CN125_02570 [Sinorhizobium meliloti]RVM47116.1 hypothetical protein CN121_14015 [Sinorhizobium meliloti]RVM70944.1 hypothetical protein CN123_07975 [Sinorhizobium meliloti]RVM73857.1 hypothetical protein CN124_01685 [Sinorhizobium meliloti]